MSKENTGILYIDIETSPNICTSWRVGYNINLTPDNIIEERQIICISYKWAHEKKVHTLHWGVKKQCDKELLIKISEVINQAKLVVGHNGDRFDMKWINSRLFYHGLSPLLPVPTEDTLKMVKQKFYLNSNRLDYIGKFLKVGAKVQTGGFKLWKDVHLNKCAKAMKKMIKYCEQDVLLLQKVHEKVAPFTQRKVHLYSGSAADCLNCGSRSFIKNSTYTTKAGTKKKVLTCTDCRTSRSIPYTKYLKMIDA
jgi:DNA polymerase elongation subunit (family B)